MRFFTLEGESLDQPREWEPAVLDLEVDTAEWESVRFAVNESDVQVSAARRFGEARVLADWPRSGPGAYRLRLWSPSGATEEVVRVGSAKLGPTGLAALLADLERRLPVSIALGLQRTGGLVGLRIQPPAENTAEQEILRLRRAVRGTERGPGLARLLPAVAVDPHHMLHREDRWVRWEAARRVPVTGLVQTLTRPGNLDGAGRPERALDSRVFRSVDVYENRLLKSFTSEVSGRLRRLERTITGEAISAEASALRAVLESACQRAPFLSDVGSLASGADRLTIVLLREPRYRAVLDRFREFHRSLWVELVDDDLNAPLQNLPSLYQSWGTLGVVDALLEVAAEAGYQVIHQRLVRRRPGTLFVQALRDGEPVLRLRHPEHGTVVTCTSERTFGATGDLRSISFQQRPDVVVEIRRPNGEADLVVFDPKYKLDGDDEGGGRPIKSDVDKMHSYRDSIRDCSGRRVVRFAGTLYPGETRMYGDGVAAIGAMPGDEASLREVLRETLRRFVVMEDSRTPAG